MSRYRLITRRSEVTPEGKTRPLEVLEIGPTLSSGIEMAIANPSDRPREDWETHRWAIAVGSGPWPTWILVYTDRPGACETACEIAVDYALDRWPGLDATPTAEDVESEAFDVAGGRDGVAREITDEIRWEAFDRLTEGCISDGSGRYAEVPAIHEIGDRGDLIAFLYRGTPTPSDADTVTDRHAGAVRAMLLGLHAMACGADRLAREGQILGALDEMTARHMAG